MESGCERIFQCIKCLKKYFSAYALKRHMTLSQCLPPIPGTSASSTCAAPSDNS